MKKKSSPDILTTIVNDNCENYLNQYYNEKFDLTFFDPPFNQNKKYNSYNDNMPEDEYWNWLQQISKLIFENTSKGGAIYFMQREKNVEQVLEIIRNTGWNFQNLIIWKKKTSAIPGGDYRFGKHYQIIVYATKGEKPRVFNRLRIQPTLLVTEKYQRKTGMYLTDVWDDIRELTSGYHAGKEPLRNTKKERIHNQQSPIALLTRIILSSTKIGDLVFDPFAGTGTTLVASNQLERNSIGIEIDKKHSSKIKSRIVKPRDSDKISKLRNNYIFTKNLNKIWKKYDGKTSLDDFNKK